MNKKGITIIELVVAIGIFAVISTMAVGAFVTTVRMKSLTTSMAESQQKIRMATEMITRLSRQANKVSVSNDGKTLELYFGITAATSFTIKNETGAVYGLYMADCSSPSVSSCTAWNSPVDLLSGTVYLDTDSMFQKNGNTSPATLTVKLRGKITDMPTNPSNPYYNDVLLINTMVVLENLR